MNENDMSLEERVLAFQRLELPGQPIGMHMGTSYLVNDLWKEVQHLDAERKNKEADEIRLRQMLAYCYAGSDLYSDDGELQDNRQIPHIDFRRDSVETIQEKVTAQRDRAQAVVRIMERGLGIFNWRTRHDQVIKEARENSNG